MGMTVNNSDVVLTTSAAGVVGSTANSQITVLKGTVVNYDTIAHVVTLWRVPNAGSAGNTNLVVDQFPVGAAQGASILPISGLTLVGGQTLQAKADIGSLVNLNVSFTMVP